MKSDGQITNIHIAELSGAQQEKFWSNVDKTSSVSGCWLWKSDKDYSGYGAFWDGRKKLLAHRVSFVLSGGTFDGGPFVLHGPCNNPSCVNPAHLSSGTQKKNAEDRNRDGKTARGDKHWSRLNPEKIARGDRHSSRTRPESLPRGDAHWSRVRPESVQRGDQHFTRRNPEMVLQGEARGNSKLNADQVLAIRARAKSGETGVSIARFFGVSAALVGMIIRRTSWKHI